MEGNVPLTFLDDVDQFIKEYLGIGKITGEVVATDLVAIIKSIGDVGMQCLQTGIIIGRQPEHHAPVCGVRVLKLWAVKDTGRYQADITVFQGIDILADRRDRRPEKSKSHNNRDGAWTHQPRSCPHNKRSQNLWSASPAVHQIVSGNVLPCDFSYLVYKT